MGRAQYTPRASWPRVQPFAPCSGTARSPQWTMALAGQATRCRAAAWSLDWPTRRQRRTGRSGPRPACTDLAAMRAWRKCPQRSGQGPVSWRGCAESVGGGVQTLGRWFRWPSRLASFTSVYFTRHLAVHYYSSSFFQIRKPAGINRGRPTASRSFLLQSRGARAVFTDEFGLNGPAGWQQCQQCAVRPPEWRGWASGIYTAKGRGGPGRAGPGTGPCSRELRPIS